MHRTSCQPCHIKSILEGPFHYFYMAVGVVQYGVLMCYHTAQCEKHLQQRARQSFRRFPAIWSKTWTFAVKIQCYRYQEGSLPKCFPFSFSRFLKIGAQSKSGNISRTHIHHLQQIWVRCMHCPRQKALRNSIATVRSAATKGRVYSHCSNHFYIESLTVHQPLTGRSVAGCSFPS